MPSFKDISIFAFVVALGVTTGGSSVMAQDCYRNGDKLSVRGTFKTETCLTHDGSSELQTLCKDNITPWSVLHLDKPLCVADALNSDDQMLSHITMIELDLSQTPSNAEGTKPGVAPDYSNKKVEVGGVLQQQRPGDPKWNWVGAYAIKVNSIIPDTDNAQP